MSRPTPSRVGELENLADAADDPTLGLTLLGEADALREKWHVPRREHFASVAEIVAELQWLAGEAAEVDHTDVRRRAGLWRSSSSAGGAAHTASARSGL
jgi:hypothetical protein